MTDTKPRQPRKRLRLADLVPGRTYLLRGETRVVFNGLHTAQSSPGRYYQAAMVTLPEGRQASVSIKHLTEAPEER